MRDVITMAVAISIFVFGVFLAFAGGDSALVHAVGFIIMLISGVVVGWRLSPYVADGLGASFYLTQSKLDREPEQLTRLEGMAISGQAPEAVAELEKILKKRFNQIEARQLLVKIYLNHFHDRESAGKHLKKFFDSPKHFSGPESLDLLFLYGDMLDEDGERARAAHYYTRELRRGKFPKADKDLLMNRINALKDS